MTRRSRAQGSIYRRRGKDGKPEAAWTIAYRANGRRHIERAYADRAASEQLLAKKLREAAREEMGLLDPYRKAKARPISEHVADFLASIESRNRTAKHLTVTKARLGAALKGMVASRLGQMDLARAERFLGSLLAKGTSAKTRDHYAAVLRQFGGWLEDADRWPRNVLARLKPVATTADVRRERMALTAEQVLRLADAAYERPLQWFVGAHSGDDAKFQTVIDGQRRGVLYLFSAMTGLRRNECRGIRWADLQLTGDEPTVRPRAATTKARREEPLPLVEPLRTKLQHMGEDIAMRRRRPIRGSEMVFRIPKNLSELVRKDAEFADIPTSDDRGRRLDFHSLRATFATLIARAGVPLQVGRRLIRHSSPAMTAKHYEKLDSADLRAGAQVLSEVFAAAAATTATRPNATARDDARPNTTKGNKTDAS